MPVKRRYNVKGTNDFLVLSAIFFFLCIWAIKDAWFPSEKVLKRHPSEVAISFETAGSVEKVFVELDHSTGERQLLAKLRNDRLSLDYEDAKEIYTETKKKFAMMELALRNARENGASDEGMADIEKRTDVAKTAMEDALSKVVELKKSLDATELLAPCKGVVKEIKIATHSMVDAGETVMVIDPKDHFYLFNKSLAVFSFFAFWIFLAIHILAR